MKAVSPRSLGEAVDLLAGDTRLRPIAGCTDVMVPGAAPPVTSGVLDLLRVREIAGIRAVADGFEIGATTTFAQLARHEEIRRAMPAVCDAAAIVGGWQVQARATVGGNIATASPAGDSLPLWLVLGATLIATGPDGSRRIPYDRVHLGYRATALRPGEIIEKLLVPNPRPGTVLWFRKVGTRQALAISKVVIAAAVELEDGIVCGARLAAGSVAPVPVRLTEIERLLIGRRPAREVADEAGRLASAAVHPIDDVRSTAAYRSHVLARAIRRFVLTLAADGAGESQ